MHLPPPTFSEPARSIRAIGCNDHNFGIFRALDTDMKPLTEKACILSEAPNATTKQPTVSLHDDFNYLTDTDSLLDITECKSLHRHMIVDMLEVDLVLSTRNPLADFGDNRLIIHRDCSHACLRALVASHERAQCCVPLDVLPHKFPGRRKGL
jgi:hypothetical protein